MQRLDRSIARFRRHGDAAALATAFDLAAPELLRVARHLCADEADAEDAVQATFEVLIRKADAHDGRRAVMPWLVGILNLEARKLRERAARRPDPERLAEHLAERGPEDPADEAEREELRALVHTAVERLPPTYAQPLLRLLRDGQGPDEIATAMGLTREAVRMRLWRGQRLLRAALPAGSAVGLLLAPTAPRGLAQVRAAVIESGRRAVVPGATAAVAVGGSTAMLPVALAAGALVAAATAIGVLLGGDDHTSAHAGETLAAAPVAAAPEDGARQDVAPTPTADAIDLRSSVPVAAGAAPVAQADDAEGLSADAWLARFAAAEGWREIVPLGREVAALGEPRALELMRAIYHRLPTVDHRQQVLKAFVFHPAAPYALEVLDLAANDPSLEVQSWAWTYLADYAFEDFSTHPQDYAAWRRAQAGRPVAAVMADGLAGLGARLSAATPGQAGALLETLDPPDPRLARTAGLELAAVARERGLYAALVALAIGADADASARALRWLEPFEPDDGLLRERLLPLLDGLAQEDDGPSAARAEASLRLLVERRPDWLADELLRRARLEPERHLDDDALFEALGALGDPRVVTEAIEFLCRHADHPRAGRTLSLRVLGPLTGATVLGDETCETWRTWLAANGARLADAIAAWETERAR